MFIVACDGLVSHSRCIPGSHECYWDVPGIGFSSPVSLTRIKQLKMNWDLSNWMFTWVSPLKTRLLANENVWADSMALCQFTPHLVSSFTCFVLCVTLFRIWRTSSLQVSALFFHTLCVCDAKLMHLPYFFFFLHESRQDFISSHANNILSHCKTLTWLITATYCSNSFSAEIQAFHVSYNFLILPAPIFRSSFDACSITELRGMVLSEVM